MEQLLTIVIPAYNEEEALQLYLPEVIAHCREKQYQLVVVNDGSSDGTAQVLQQYEQESFFKVVTHKLNRGYGGAIKSGVKAANTQFVITIDADGQHELSDVDTLLQLAQDKDADMVVGSRKGQKSTSAYRSLGKSMIRQIAKILMPMDLYDLNSGMKLYNTELGKNYLHLCPNSMAYSDIIALVFISQRHLVLEQPITINQRVAGNSTISTATAFETVKEILNIVVLFNPLRIFLPISILAIVLGVAWGVSRLIYVGDGISVGAMLSITTGLIFFFLGLMAEQLSLIRKGKL